MNLPGHDAGGYLTAMDGRTNKFGEGKRVRMDRSGAGVVTYVYGAEGELKAEYGGGPGSGRGYLTQDHLGSTRMVTGETGTVAAGYDYLPFGEVVRESGGMAGQTVRFTGKERDEGTGLDNFLARYYSAPVGRFTSPDVPFADQGAEDPQSWNLYSYARNNPLAYTDPTGRSVQVCTPGFEFPGLGQGGNSVRSDCRTLTDEEYRKLREQGPLGNGGILPSIPGGGGTEFSINPIFCGQRQCGEVFYLNDSPGMKDGTLEAFAFFRNPLGYIVGMVAPPGVSVAGNPGRFRGGGSPEKPPELITNPKHHPNSASQQPSNAKDLFKNAVVDKNGVRWVKDADGTIHRFSAPSNGQTHWNGSTAGKKPIRTDRIPNEIRKRFQ